MRKRSNYKPKGVRLDVMGWIKQGMQSMATHTEAVTVRLRNHAAMDEMVNGRGTRDHCDIIIAALNMTEALSILRIGDEYRTEINAAQDAMLTTSRRGLANNRFLFTGQELTAINTAMEIHDAQLDACTVAELEKAIDIVKMTVRAKKARVIEVVV